MSRYITAVIAALLVIMMCVGCSNKTAKTSSECDKQEGEHKAAHGGSLNAIVTCENGHAEVKLDGNKMQMWFVGGGPNTDKSIRVPDKSISLQIDAKGSKKTLILTPKPLELAGEKVGDCSYFEGNAPWLNGTKEFNASGQITFKGKNMPLKIEYPKGYDPD